ncbi:MAG TPA: molecular chaperone HtpG [Stellaceae bacterium]|jgi:molecular chaperone HtpG|nr:molecular chaperone HtpG [Stellaceae bacterium]
MAAEKRTFQAEVSRLLDIVAHSLYSQKEIFLRELISNASDACDRLRYLALTQPALIGEDAAFRVVLEPNAQRRTLTVSDNGIGMSREELIENLGTIARSGTAQFLEQLSGDERKDRTLIGQFGVGFYSSFMVADQVEVVSRKAGADEASRWVSDGKGEFTVEAGERASRGTTIVLRLREDAAEFVEPSRLRDIVKTYSDHVALPIVLDHKGKEETLNAASALWMRAKSEIKPEQYKEFYHHVGHAGDEPWLALHWKAEGLIEYTGLLFVPSAKPFDLFDPLRKHRLKLYVRRVFITDDCQELLPPWLRFVRGVIDSEDLPLNVSREMLQSNPMLARIRSQIVKRVLAELQKKAKDAPEDYAKFWENFGAVLKEGLYEDRDERDQLLPLARFRSTASEGLVSLEDYAARMKPGQEAIYTIAGDNLDLLKKSPQLEGFRAKGVEVLLLTDPVDEFWAPAIGKYKDWSFKSTTRGGADLAKIGGAEAEKKNGAEAAKSDPNAASVVAMFKLALGEAVKDVRLSERLTDSPVCLVADEGDLDIHLERMLRQHRQLDALSKRILEVNPRHPLVARLASQIGKDGASVVISEVAWVLLDQARIIEGESLPDPAAFSRRLSALLEKGLG